MTTTQFDPAPPPTRTSRWQDWANLVLAIWLFISPWVLRFGAVQTAAPGATGAGAPVAGAGNAAWNAWVLGVVVFLVALSAIGRMEFWQERIAMLLGIWIFIAPWVLGFTARSAASWDHWIVGALIFLIAAWNLTQARRMPASVGMAHAGNKPPRDV